jgi:hypothetical protein
MKLLEVNMASGISYWLIDVSDYPDNREIGKFDSREKADKVRSSRKDADILVVVPANDLFDALDKVEKYSTLGHNYFEKKMKQSFDFSDILVMDKRLIYSEALSL